MNDIKAILFDFDGTILDTEKVIIDSWQTVFREIEGKEAQVEELLKTLGEPLYDTMNTFFGERAAECLKIYRNYQQGIFLDEIKLFQGMKELILDLKSANYKLALVTSRLAKSTMEALDKYNLTEVFDAIITCDDTEKHKPNPEPALLALEKIGELPQNAILLGDSQYDINCGKNAGIKTVLVGWSATFDKTVKLSPDYIINKAEELKVLLEE